MDDPELSQHVCESTIKIRPVIFMTPHGRSKETMSIPFIKQTVLPTRLVIPDDLAGHRQSFIIIQQLHIILQKPYLISSLLKWIGSSDSGAIANASMMRNITVPTFSSASSGDVSFVAFFTYGIFHIATFKLNDRSKIALDFLLLCGIIGNGEIFKFESGFCFMSSHLTIVSNPCADFSP